MKDKDTQLSKSLSWILRHGAVRERLPISTEGYIPVEQVLQHRSFKGKYSKNDIERVVATNAKQRFKLRVNPLSNVLEIRANQGHSILTVSDTDLTPILEPKYNTVVHGTYLKYWPLIKSQGLSRMKRKHIHLAKGTLHDTNVTSGLRADTQIYIFIDLQKALDAGLKFFESDNGVILTGGNENGYLDIAYFSKVVEVHTDKIVLRAQFLVEGTERNRLVDKDESGDLVNKVMVKQFKPKTIISIKMANAMPVATASQSAQESASTPPTITPTASSSPVTVSRSPTAAPAGASSPATDAMSPPKDEGVKPPPKSQPSSRPPLAEATDAPSPKTAPRAPNPTEELPNMPPPAAPSPGGGGGGGGGCGVEARVSVQAAPRARPPFPAGKPHRPPPHRSPAHRSNTDRGSLPNKKQKSSPAPPPPPAHAPAHAPPPTENNFDSNACRIEVTGFPPYTRAQDLFRTFACYGRLRVEKVTKKYAIIAFTTKREAKLAVQDTQRVNVYGQFVSVRLASGDGDGGGGGGGGGGGHRDRSNKNGFARTKQKAGRVPAPQAALVAGGAHAQLDGVLAAVRLTQEEVAALGALYADLERVLQPAWPGCQAMPFGSITTGLGVKSSDADCFVNIPPQYRHPNVSFVNKAKRILQQYPQTFTEIIAIPRANTPIVKFFHVPTGTHCDLTFKTPLGALNSKLIAFLLHADPRFIPMAVVVKYWAKVHGLSGTGKLTNYALTMLIVFFLQQPPPGLPPVEWLQRERGSEVLVDNWNTGFMHDYERLPRTENTATICELLGGFFRFYADFDFDALVVCPFLGRPVEKTHFKDLNTLPHEFRLYKHNVLNSNVIPFKFTSPMCVQDPFEQSHNVASTVTVRMAADIKAFFKFAAEAYDKEKENNCDGFLRTLLVEKPKLTRHKGHPEFRVSLHPKVIRAITDPDWKATVREIVFIIFEQMLKIPLKLDEPKEDNAENNGPGKEKERYVGALKKPIWKRKQFTKLYHAMSLDLIERETRITEEIMNVDKNDTPVTFHLSLVFYVKSLNVKVALKYLEGEADDFRSFAKVFLNVTYEWFVGVLRDRNSALDQQGSDKAGESENVASSQESETSTDRTEEDTKGAESSEGEDLAEDTSNLDTSSLTSGCID